MLLRTVPVGRLLTNCYLVADDRTRHALVVDPGADAERILHAIRQFSLRVELIALTHSHYDHILAAERVRAQTGAPLAIHASEAAHLAGPPGLLPGLAPGDTPRIEADRILDEGDLLAFGGLSAEVLHTPGHSPGGVSLWIASEGVVFCGDLLFREGVGRTDFSGSSLPILERSIRERLFALPPETVVYPGHGPSTTIAHERARNPWLGT